MSSYLFFYGMVYIPFQCYAEDDTPPHQNIGLAQQEAQGTTLIKVPIPSDQLTFLVQIYTPINHLKNMPACIGIFLEQQYNTDLLIEHTHHAHCSSQEILWFSISDTFNKPINIYYIDWHSSYVGNILIDDFPYELSAHTILQFDDLKATHDRHTLYAISSPKQVSIMPSASPEKWVQQNLQFLTFLKEKEELHFPPPIVVIPPEASNNIYEGMMSSYGDIQTEMVNNQDITSEDARTLPNEVFMII